MDQAMYDVAAMIPDDGPGSEARIGLIALSNDVVIEGELRLMIDVRDIGLHVSRMPLAGVGTVEGLLALKDHIPSAARAIVPDDRLDVLAFGCTSASVVIGEAEITQLARAGRRGAAIPCVNPVTAVKRALLSVGARRIALLCPYTRPIAEKMAQSLTCGGFAVARVVSFNQAGDTRISKIPPAAVLAAAESIQTDDCDALFVSCTALRVASVIEQIEQRIRKPVVTSNQALLWDALANVTGCRPIGGYGSLMRDAA
jgi:maleate isomerase